MKVKKGFSFFITILFLIQGISSLQAQTTIEKDFWLTFGQLDTRPYTQVDMQIRIVSGDKPVSGTIHFTNLGTSVPFSMGTNEVFTYPLTEPQKQAVYNTTIEKSNKSVHINSNEPIKVYALIQRNGGADATNILPVEVLAKNYYQISYLPWPSSRSDAYAVVAINNNTQLYQNGGYVETLHTGDVYYMTSTTDMTGYQITANNVIAFFAVNQGVLIPTTATCCGEPLMQQLVPVFTWGKNFFVPVSLLTKDRVRIVAAFNNTTITHTGAFIYSSSGNNTINAGQYIELEVLLSDNGCSIQATNPVGVCTYLTSMSYNPIFTSDAAQAWLPAIEQMGKSAMIAPFIPDGTTQINQHYGIIITPFATKESTKVSIGGGVPAALSGGNWYDNLTVTPQMSFYIMPLTHATASYNFTNSKGLIVMCYGIGPAESYYYLAGSAMRDLEAAFYANDVHFQDLKENPFCENEVEFRAEIEGELHTESPRIKWEIDGSEYLPARDQLEWNKIFLPGEYEIKMWVRFENNDTISKTGNLIIEICDLPAEFYVNNIHHEDLPSTTICTKDVVNFRAEIEGINPNPGSLKWYIDDVEEVPAQDQLQWSKELPTGTYNIKMWVLFEDNQEITIESTLNVEVFWVKIKNIKY